MKSSYKEIAKKYDVSVDALRRHFKDHIVRHIMPIVTHYDEKTEKFFIHTFIDGEACMVPADVLIKEVRKSRMTVCETEEEIDKGRRHSAKVREHYEKTGDMKVFKKQIKNLLKLYPGFQPVV